MEDVETPKERPDYSVLFTHANPQQAYRLLELPPSLMELLASDNPPVYVDGLCMD
jgi:hypothetical protein